MPKQRMTAIGFKSEPRLTHQTQNKWTQHSFVCVLLACTLRFQLCFQRLPPKHIVPSHRGQCFEAIPNRTKFWQLTLNQVGISFVIVGLCDGDCISNNGVSISQRYGIASFSRLTAINAVTGREASLLSSCRLMSINEQDIITHKSWVRDCQPR
jgi:hypothetical protein